MGGALLQQTKTSDDGRNTRNKRITINLALALSQAHKQSGRCVSTTGVCDTHVCVALDEMGPTRASTSTEAQQIGTDHPTTSEIRKQREGKKPWALHDVHIFFLPKH